MKQFRVFISYSHEDKEDIKTVARILKENGLDPIYDKNIQGGQPFGELIKRYIQHAHVFIPIITEKSSTRGWVHQEIGYASSLNIPIIPVSKGELNLPSEMLRELHAVRLDDDIDNLKQNLSYQVFVNLIEACSFENATYFCSEQPAERAIMMAKLANNARAMNFSGLLRQRGGLSSFHIPDKIVSNKTWTKRYHPVLKNEYHCKCQFGERKALERHVVESGCKLIINPAIITDNYHPVAQRARLQTFLDFLESMPKEKIDIAIDEEMGMSESVTLLGDIFSAESYFRSETQGFMYTMFTTHAVAIQNKVENFDNDFEALLEENGTKQGETLENTKELISKLISEIE